jgi:hypothetical protein
MLLKMPVGQALNAHTALQKMLAAQFPAKQAFAISRNIARLGACPDVPACEAARLAAIRNFGVPLPDGAGMTVPPERMAEFLAEFQPIAVAEIELDITPIPVAVLERAPDMSPSDMMALEPFWEA